MKRGLILLTILAFLLSQTVSGDLVNPITEAFIQLSDVTTNNFSTTKHGFVPKGTNVGNCLKDDGNWGSCAAAGSGEANTASNLGTGLGLFSAKSGVDLQFKSVSSTRNVIQISSDASTVYLDLPTSYTRSSKLLSAVRGSTFTTYADVAGLVSDSLASGTYQILFAGEFATSATTTGIGFRVASGTATVSQMAIKWEMQQAAAGTDMFFQYSQKSTADNVASTAVVAANTNYTATGHGFLVLSASGTVALQFRSEVASSNVEVKSGSNFILHKVE